MEWYHYVLCVGVGLVTGFINTLAGSGTLLTMPFFLYLGLPADIANGTNRLGIFAQTLVSTVVLRQQMRTQLKGAALLIVPAVIGGGLGAYAASVAPDKFLEGVIAVVMILLIYPVLRNNDKWMRTENVSGEIQRKPLMVVIFSGLGFYAGFIQAGAGIFILSSIVLLAGKSLQYGNLLKNVMVFLLTIPALIVFIVQGQVNWEIGIIVMVAQSFSAWFAAKFLGQSPKANQVVRYLLIVMLLVGAVSIILRMV